jgi:hypothetical protein
LRDNLILGNALGLSEELVQDSKPRALILMVIVQMLEAFR